MVCIALAKFVYAKLQSSFTSDMHSTWGCAFQTPHMHFISHLMLTFRWALIQANFDPIQEIGWVLVWVGIDTTTIFGRNSVGVHHTVIPSCPRQASNVRSQLKHQNLRVTWRRCLNGSTIPMPTSTKLGPHRWFVRASLRPAQQWRRLYHATKWTDL